MGQPLEFTREDLLRGEIVEPGWYTIEIKSYEEGPTKDTLSFNRILNAVVVCNAGNGDVQFAGVPIKLNFNSKTPGFAVGYLAALGISAEEGKRYDLEKTVGETVDAFIANRTWQDRLVNDVKHQYRTVKK